jgi:hypothetical protein
MNHNPTCCVRGCSAPATYDVFLADYYDDYGSFLEADFGCSHICHAHALENEQKARGIRAARCPMHYPYTGGSMTGYTLYRRRDTGQFLPLIDGAFVGLNDD